MITRLTRNMSICVKWKPIQPSGGVTYRVVEMGYELCSKFETIWFLTIGRFNVMVSRFDHTAAAAARVKPVVKIAALPLIPFSSRHAGECQVLKFPVQK